jgi:23S rRNA (guanosine2251-2'-O)-methyltransferase
LRERPIRPDRRPGRPGTHPPELLRGVHPVREALRARRRELSRLFVREGRPRQDLDDLAAAAARAGVLVERCSPDAPDSPVGSGSQGVALEAGPLPELPFEELLADRPAGRSVRLVALDGVEDPQNLGAIARAAEASGTRGLLLTKRRSPPLSPAVARASAGAIEHLPVARVPNLPRALKLLKNKGFWSIGADSVKGDDWFSFPDRLAQGDLVIVLGAEGRGLRPGILDAVDHRVRIPMVGRVGSLNVAAAAAVLLFDLLRRERGAPRA